jgi:hypothetical protein
MTAPKLSERAQSEAIGGLRCRHDMVEAWCSWCRGLSEDGIAFDIIGKGE